MGEKGREDSDRMIRDYFDSLLVEMRYIDGRKPDTSFTLYGETFATPIMTAAALCFKYVCEKEAVEIARGAKAVGAVNWVEIEEKEAFAEITGIGAKTINVIKPYADNKEVFSRIEWAQKCGALAIGMDLDYAFDSRGEYGFVRGYGMAPKSMEEIREFAKTAEIPFIIKGILSERDAYKCVMAGAGGIVMSPRHDVENYAVPPLMVLPDILRVVDSQIPVFVDCGITSGTDAFKALAMGACAVFAGCALMESFGGRGADAVSERISRMNDELKGVMARTGCYDLSHMDKTILRQIRTM